MTKLYILLKAHATKTIMVPGYTRKDGTIVPPHQKVVHYDPDKSQHDVINGRGNNVQKMAHKQAQKHDHYHKMSDEDKHNYILHLATDIHNQRMRADALARFKAGFKDGKLPQVSQYNVFMNESKEDQEKILSDLRGKFGNERVDAVMSAMAEKAKGTGKKAPKKTAEKKPELTLEHTTPEQLKQEDEARQAEAKRKEAEEKAAAQREQADKESENFTLTGSDSMRDQAAAHGQQDMLDAFDGKDEKKPEKITNDAKGLKTLISTVDEDHAKILKRLIRTSHIHFDDRDPVSYDTPFLKVWLQRNHKGMVNGNIQLHDTFKGWNIHHFDNVPFDDFVSAAYGGNKPDTDKIKSLMIAIQDGIFGKQAQKYAGSMVIHRDGDEHQNEVELRAFVEDHKKQLGEATAKKIEEFLDGNSNPEKLDQKHSGSQVHDNGDGTYTVFTPLADAKYIGGVAANAKKMGGRDDYWHNDNRPDTLHRGYQFGSKDKAEKFQKWLHDNEPEMKYQETMRYADKKFNNWYEKTSTIGNAVYEYGRLDTEKTQINILNNTKATQEMPDGSKFTFNLDRHRTFEKEGGVWKNERNTTKAIESRKKRLDKRYIEVDEFKQQIAQKKADGKETSLDEIRLRRMERDVEYEEKSLGVDKPKEGDTKTIDGNTYVLQGGRWHRQTEEVKQPEEPKTDAPEPSSEETAAAAPEASGGYTQSTVTKTKHTTKGHDLWAVKLSGRVSLDTFKKVREECTNLGGYYSSYNKDGAISGFQFKTPEAAEQFQKRMEELKPVDLENVQAQPEKESKQPKEAIKQPDLQENRKTEPENAKKQASERKTEILTNTIDAVETAFSRHNNNRVKEENRNAAKEQLSKIKASGAEGALIHDLLNPFNSSWKDISGKVISRVKDGADLFDAMTEVFLEKYPEGRYVDGKGAWNGGVKSNNPEKVKESFRSQFAGYAEAEAFYREHGKHRWQVEEEEKKARLEKEAEERATPEKAKHNQTILDRLEYLKNNKPSEYDMRKEFLDAQNDYSAYRGALQEVLSGIEENQREVLSSVENYIVDDLVNHYGGSVVDHFHRKDDVRTKALEYYKQGYDIFDAVAKAQDELHKIEDVKSYLERKYESAKKDLDERLKNQGHSYPANTALIIREMLGKDDEYSRKFIEQVRASGARNAAIVSIMENSPALRDKVGFGFDLGFPAVNHALDMRDPDTALFEKGAKILNKATGSRKNAASFKKWCEAESEKAKQKLASEPKPKEGDTKVIDGVTYVLQGGRWHRQTEKPKEEKKPVTTEQVKKEADKAVRESIADDLSNVGPYKPAQKAPVDIVDSDGNQTSVSENGIQDAGRHMNARKDEFATYAKKINADFGNQVFQVGKHFPVPNYEKLARDGVDHKDLATLYFIREYVSGLKKPKNVKKEDEEFYKRSYPGWWKKHVDEVFSYNAKVKKLLTRAKGIADGTYSADDFRKEFAFNNAGEENLKLVLELGYPAFTQSKGYKILESKYKVTNPDGSVSLYDYIPRYAKDDGFKVQEGKFYSIANGYRIGKMFMSDDEDNYQAAVDALRADLEEKAGETGNGKKRANVRLDCYFNHRKQAYFVGRVISGSRTIELSPPLGSKKEVLEYKRNHEAELAAKWKEMAKTPNVRGAVNATRKGGEDWLKGSNATQEQFMSKFNFSGTTYGNWTNQEERQEFLNHMYNCMMDMSQITGIEPGNMSLKGGLGIQYGASGHGRALAHYTPQELAINLTKMKGAGSIAHEWFHALDDHIGRLEGCGVGGFITKGHKTVETPQTHTDVVNAVKELMTAIHDSPFITRSAKLDGYRPDSAAYWTLPHELAARAFESYISDKSEAMGLRNNFLCKYMTKEDYDAMRMQEAEDSDYPYPTGDEKTAINAAFDKLFKALKTAEKAKGKSLLAKAIRRKGLMFLIKKH